MNQSNTVHQLCLQISVQQEVLRLIFQPLVSSFVKRLLLATGVTVDGLCVTLLAVPGRGGGGGSRPVPPEEHPGAAQAEVEQLKLLLVLLQAGHGQRQGLLQLVIPAAAWLTLLLNLGGATCGLLQERPISMVSIIRHLGLSHYLFLKVNEGSVGT